MRKSLATQLASVNTPKPIKTDMILDFLIQNTFHEMQLINECNLFLRKFTTS